MRISVIIAAVISIGSSSSVAGISFILEKEVIVPGPLYGVYNHRFVDYDRDNKPELIAWDSLYAEVLSLTGDSVIVIKNMGSGWGQRLLFSDVNRDSVPDMVVARSTKDGLFIYHTVITAYDGASKFETVTKDSMTSVVIGNYSHGIIGEFNALDVDGDGYGELVTSIDSAIDDLSPSGDYLWYSRAHTYCYHGFPDSLLWRRQYYLDNIIDMSSQRGPRAALSECYRFYVSRHQSGPGTDNYSFTTTLNRISPDGLFIDQIGEVDFGWCNVTEIQNMNYNTFACTGDIDTMIPGQEVLVKYHRELHGYPLCGLSVDSLILYSLTDSSAERVWAVSLGVVPGYSRSVYLGNYPGKFFAVGGGKVHEFDGRTGLKIDSSTAVPPGYLYWDDPFGDGNQRLVSVSGVTLRIYAIGSATYADDPVDRDQLPVQFDLHAVYPNPFNPMTTVSFQFPKRQRATVIVYDVTGRTVKLLADRVFSAGAHQVVWDGTRVDGNPAGSGVYFFRLSTKGFDKTVKGALIK